MFTASSLGYPGQVRGGAAPAGVALGQGDVDGAPDEPTVPVRLQGGSVEPAIEPFRRAEEPAGVLAVLRPALQVGDVEAALGRRPDDVVRQPAGEGLAKDALGGSAPEA